MTEIPDEIKELIDDVGHDPQNPEYLHRDLRPYYQAGGEGGGLAWPMLRHPLVYQVPFFSWKQANKAYEVKSQHYDRRVAEQDWEGALALLERPSRLPRLAAWWLAGMIDLADLQEQLPWVWTDTEFPNQFDDAPYFLFRDAGYVTDTEDPLPERPFTVYQAGSGRGLSWSLDLDVARFFAARFGENRKIYRTVVTDEQTIFAWLKGRNEAEVVLDPETLGDTEEVAT